MIINNGIWRAVALAEHVVLEIHSLIYLVAVDETLEKNPIGGRRRIHGGIFFDDESIVFQGIVGFAAVAVCLEEKVVGDDRGGDAGLSDETVEGEEIGVAALAEEGGEHGVAGKDRGPAVGVDGVANEKRGLVEIVLAD